MFRTDRYEYMPTEQLLPSEMNRLGEQGWEFICIVGSNKWLWKRRLALLERRRIKKNSEE
jgi:hypothetical protein